MPASSKQHHLPFVGPLPQAEWVFMQVICVGCDGRGLRLFSAALPLTDGDRGVRGRKWGAVGSPKTENARPHFPYQMLLLSREGDLTLQGSTLKSTKAFDCCQQAQ